MSASPRPWDNGLPEHDSHGWAIWRRNWAIECVDAAQELHLLRNWHPAQPTLVGVPGAKQFAAPCAVDELASPLLAALHRRQRTRLLRWFGLMLLAMAVFPFYRYFLLLMLIVALASGIVLVGVTERLYRNAQAATERVLFSYWLHNNHPFKRYLRDWTLFSLFIGIGQLALQRLLGGFDALTNQWGLLFSSLAAGEYWRLLSGPFLHADFLHYLGNVTLLIPLAALSWLILGFWLTTTTFLGGSIIGAIVTIGLADAALAGVYSGFSGGVFALCSLLATAGRLCLRRLPRGLANELAAMTGVILLGSEIFPDTATAAHLGGLGFGLLMALAMYVHERWCSGNAGLSE